ncbi:MAG: (2Fe-2S)-binding protein [Pseudomonadota bacterium]
MKTPVTFTLNGSEAAAFADPGQNLLDLLRRGLGDLSPKYGCGQGTCGTCTVLIDGEPHLSCLVLAEAAQDRRIETAGGLADGPDLHPLQTAFVEGFAAQCGYCTPGMLLAAKALLDRNPTPTRDEVIEAISGNLCRCTGYEPIIEAILTASRAPNRAPNRAPGRTNGRAG